MAENSSGDISGVKFLTVAEVATVMRVSKMTVYRLVHSGELPAVRVGRSFRVPEDAVNGQTLHLVLEVRDAAVLPLKTYRRLVVTVERR